MDHKDLEHVKLNMNLCEHKDRTLTESDQEKLKEYGFMDLYDLYDYSDNDEDREWHWEGEASMNYQQLKGFIRFLETTEPYREYCNSITIEIENDLSTRWQCYKCSVTNIGRNCEKCNSDYLVEKFKEYYIKNLEKESQEVQDYHNIENKPYWYIYVGRY